MTDLFIKVLDMSFTGAIVICCVILVRSLLRRAPKIWSYALWSVVLFRLLCPVAISVPVAPLELTAPQVTHYGEYASTISYIPAQLTELSVPGPSLGAEAAAEAGNAVSVLDICAVLWLCGIVVLALYSAVAYLQLRRELVGAVHLERC